MMSERYFLMPQFGGERARGEYHSYRMAAGGEEGAAGTINPSTRHHQWQGETHTLASMNLFLCVCTLHVQYLSHK